MVVKSVESQTGRTGFNTRLHVLSSVSTFFRMGFLLHRGMIYISTIFSSFSVQIEIISRVQTFCFLLSIGRHFLPVEVLN
jgi:hypothetical protein